MAPDRGAEGEAKWQTLANWSTDRAREKAILDRLIEEEIPEVAEIAETVESFGLAEEQAERWQPIVRQWAEAYVKQKANALKGADTGVFYDAGIDAAARVIAAYKGDSLYRAGGQQRLQHHGNEAREESDRVSGGEHRGRWEPDKRRHPSVERSVAGRRRDHEEREGAFGDMVAGTLRHRPEDPRPHEGR